MNPKRIPINTSSREPMHATVLELKTLLAQFSNADRQIAASSFSKSRFELTDLARPYEFYEYIKQLMDTLGSIRRRIRARYRNESGRILYKMHCKDARVIRTRLGRQVELRQYHDGSVYEISNGKTRKPKQVPTNQCLPRMIVHNGTSPIGLVLTAESIPVKGLEAVSELYRVTYLEPGNLNKMVGYAWRIYSIDILFRFCESRKEAVDTVRETYMSEFVRRAEAV